MDYERRGVRWYWVTLYIAFCIGAVYAVLTGNPYLYSHKEFKREMQSAPEQQAEPVPSPTSQLPLPATLGEQTYFARMNAQHNGDAAADVTLGKNFTETNVYPLAISENDFEISKWSMDDSGIYLGGEDDAIAFDLGGVKLWEFRFASKSPKPLSDVLTDRGLAYLIHPQGEIVALNKKSGQLQWNLKLHEEVVGPSLILNGKLLLPLKGHNIVDSKGSRPTFNWVLIQRTNGEIIRFSKPIEAKPGFEVTLAPDLDALILSYENKLVALDLEKLEVQWSQTLTDPIRGPVMVVGKTLFVSTATGKVLRLDGTKKARTEWELELEKPAVSAPTYMPVMAKLSILDDQGQLQLIDAKVGKSLWRFNIENKNELKDTWAAREKGSVIQETSMEWTHRGWTIWAPCSKNRFCIYNPAKGQLISRVPLSGSVLSMPIEKDKDLYFLIDQGKNWAISKAEVEKHKAGTAPANAPAAAPAPAGKTH